MKQFIVTSIVMLMLMLTGCGEASLGTSMSSANIKLTVDQTVALGDTMIVHATAVSTSDAPNVEVVFGLSQGLAAPADKLHQKIQLQANVPQSIELPVQLLQAGEQRVSASLYIYIGGGSLGDADLMYLEVGATDTQVRKESLTPLPVMPTQDSLPMDEIEKLLTTPTPEPPNDGANDIPTSVP